MKSLSSLVFVFLAVCMSTFGQNETDTIPVEKQKKVNFAFIPIVTYNHSFEFGFGAMAAGYYKIDKEDKISPLSKSLVGLQYFTNKSWFSLLSNSLYFKEDKYRTKAVLGAASINFQTYLDWSDYFPNYPGGGLPELPELPDDGTFIDYNTKVQMVYVEFLMNVWSKLYIGGNLLYSHTNTNFDADMIPDEELNLFGFGFSSEFDIRNSQTLPSAGYKASFNTMSFLESLGSTNSYTNINIEYNKYFPFKDRNTLLARFYGQLAVGDVPFSGKNVVGRDDLRGYSDGKFRADQVYNVQTEYRHWVAPKIALVGFGGVAVATDDFGDIFDELLPAAGAGIRYLALPKQNVTIGIDAAVGKDDWGLYFRIGEAFTK